MNEEIIIHKDQSSIEDYLNDYEDKNKYKCETYSIQEQNRWADMYYKEFLEQR